MARKHKMPKRDQCIFSFVQSKLPLPCCIPPSLPNKLVFVFLYTCQANKHKSRGEAVWRPPPRTSRPKRRMSTKKSTTPRRLCVANATKTSDHFFAIQRRPFCQTALSSSCRTLPVSCSKIWLMRVLHCRFFGAPRSYFFTKEATKMTQMFPVILFFYYRHCKKNRKAESLKTRYGRHAANKNFFA